MINDTINPMSFDITKNLHGHVRVETRDRWTGRVVDSQEKDNLVTNAVQQLLMTTAWVSATNFASVAGHFAPLPTVGLGGLLLFDGTLENNVSNTTIPTDVGLVAMCDQGSDSSAANAGSYNAAESVPTSNGFTSVWDFATSQANGTIASLARTSAELKSYFNYATSFGFYINQTAAASTLFPTSIYPLGYDAQTHSLYFASLAGTWDGVSVQTNTIYKIPLRFDSIGLSSLLPRASQWEVFKTLSTSDGTADAKAWAFDPYEKEFLYFQITQTLHVISMNGTHSTRTLSQNASNSNFGVTKSYYWRVNSGTVLRTSKTNFADTQSFTVGTTYSRIYSGDNDCVIVYAAGRTGVAIYPDGTLMNVSVPGAQYDSFRVGPFVALRASSSLFFNPRYLGTIANLDSPVTKTSSQTMKITYTLTEA